MRRVPSAAHDRGAAEALGLVLVAPVAIGLALLVVFLSRQVDSRAQVRTAAESAAQAAAQERSPAAADRGGPTGGRGDADRPRHVRLAFGRRSMSRGSRSGGLVAVTVSCSVSARGIEIVAPPDPQSTSRLFSVTATATIDRFRATEPAP